MRVRQPEPVRARKGFTLLEMLMTVTIIAILVIAVLFAANASKEKTYLASMKNDLHNYALAQARQKLDNNQYAQSPESLGTSNFSYSRDDSTVHSAGDASRWWLLVGRRGTATRCRLGGGTIPSAQSGMVCGNVDLPPMAAFRARPTPATTATYVYFDASISQAPGTPVSSYTWNFGDGTTATGINVGHQFSVVGAYHVQLIVTDTLAESDTATKTIIIDAPSGTPPSSPIVPQLAMDADSGVGRPLPLSYTPYLASGLQHLQGSCGPNCQLVAEAVRFDASATTGPGDLYTLRIEDQFPDTLGVTALRATTTGTTKQWTFMKPRPGYYRAILTVQDSAGTQAQSSTATFTIGTPPACQALVNSSHLYLRLSSTNSNGTYTTGYPFPNPDCQNADIYQVGAPVCYYGWFYDLLSPIYTPGGGGRRYQGGGAPDDHNPWLTQFDFGSGVTSTPTEYDTMYWDPSGGSVGWRTDLQTSACHTYPVPGRYTTKYSVSDRFGADSVSVQVLVTP